MNDKLGRKVTLREGSQFADDRSRSNRTGFIGIVCELTSLGGSVWCKVQWETSMCNFYGLEDLLWYDYVDDWKDVVKSWGGNVDE